MSTSRNYDLVIYGAYGYTGRLITEVCKSKGITALLSGRSEEQLQKLGKEFSFDSRAVSIEDAVALRKLVSEAKAVVHCAGPFAQTAKQMASACLESSTHYLDITGEHEVFACLHSLDGQARQAGIMLMPGIGFDVVPTDCLAAHVKNRLPEATHLQLAFAGLPTGVSRGTARTATQSFGKESLVRINGTLQSVGKKPKTTVIDYGEKKLNSVCISWGDIVTAWHTTGIPNIEVYMAASPGLVNSIRFALRWGWFFQWGPVKRFILKKINQRPAGPSEEVLGTGKTLVFGKAWRGDKSVESRLVTTNGYRLTADMAVIIAEKVVKGNFKTGFSTPAACYGPDLVLEAPRTNRYDA